MLERIDEFRQRRPRLLDEVVTLAHGAGGKVVGGARRRGLPRGIPQRRTRATRRRRGAATCPSGERLAFSTDSYVVQPRRFPGGSIGHLAVHGTINDLAVSGARPQWLSAAFVIEEGFPIAELREIVADMSEAAAAAGVPDRHRRHQGRRQGRGRRRLHLHRRRRRDPRGPAAVARPRCGRATRFCCRARSATTGWRSCWPAATWPSTPTSPRTPRR